MFSIALAALLAIPASAAAPPAGSAPKKAGSWRTVLRKGLCRFQVPKAWKLEEDWKAPAPAARAETTTPAGAVVLFATFYPDGHALYPDSEAYLKQAARPNTELEKEAEPEKTVQVSGSRARWLHIRHLDMITSAVKGLPKRFLVKDVVVGEYGGGFYALVFSAPEPAYAEFKPEFDRFLAKFEVLAPRAAPGGDPAPPSSKGAGPAEAGSGASPRTSAPSGAPPPLPQPATSAAPASPKRSVGEDAAPRPGAAGAPAPK